MRTPRLSEERGMALAVAIFALVVIGALVAGAFFASELEQRTGRNTLYAAEAAQAAETGSNSVLADWDQFNLNNMAVGDSSLLGTTSLGGRISYTPKVYRLNNDLFLVQSLGTRTDASGAIMAQRLLASISRLTYVTATANAAVTVSKPISFNGNAFSIDGHDNAPQGWNPNTENCPATSDKAGVRSDTSVYNNKNDSTQTTGQIKGVPPIVSNDPTVTNNFFDVFGDVSFDDLKKNADIVLPLTTPYPSVQPSLTAGNPQRCNTADQLNWGEPHRNGAGYVAQCTNYFPIIYGSGAQLKMTGGGRGQGMLLVEGDLEIAGGFEFVGLIVAKGGIKITGNGNKISGALLAKDVALDDDNSISGNTTLTFSSCALSKAIKGSAFAQPLANRSWVQLY
jgi:hypothetical protein